MTVYVSTRGDAPRLRFDDVTLAGLARDGGLYVPQAFPALGSEDCENLRHQSYVEAAWRVLLPYASPDIDSKDLAQLLRAAYASFRTPEVAPLRAMEDGHYLLELFHGPTFAFKDVALQFLGKLFAHILSRRDERVTIVGATSGDTGSAAIAAFAGLDNVDIVILHPKGRVSDVQRRQMTTVMAPNVHNVAVEGDFDACQSLIKAMFNDIGFRDEMRLSAINSINWARIAAQVVYYVTTSLKVQAMTGAAPAFVVPTGNFGNIYAGYVARMMGAPVGRLVAATNRNDILYRFFASGQMKRNAVEPSFSPSMDIQVASNFERLLFDLFNRKGDAVAETMKHFQQGGPFKLDAGLMESVRHVFGSGRCDDEQTLATIGDVYKGHDIVIDPHTAVGMHVARQYRQRYPAQPVVTLATAHAAKFPAAVQKAIGILPEAPEALARVMDMPERCASLPGDLATVQAHIRHAVKKG